MRDHFWGFKDLIGLLKLFVKSFPSELLGQYKEKFRKQFINLSVLLYGMAKHKKEKKTWFLHMVGIFLV